MIIQAFASFANDPLQAKALNLDVSPRGICLHESQKPPIEARTHLMSKSLQQLGRMYRSDDAKTPKERYWQKIATRDACAST